MSKAVVADLFVEDRAHEAFLVPMLLRVARQEKVAVAPRVRSARGGHGRAVRELKLYQELVRRGAGSAACPDLLIVGTDCNCMPFAKKRSEIRGATTPPFSDRLVVACPDPHVERWYLADPDSFKTVVGHGPTVGRKKCARDHYRNALLQAVRRAGHPPTLGGIEFARELVDGMDLYRAGKNDRSLKAFLDDLTNMLRALQSEGASEVE